MTTGNGTAKNARAMNATTARPTSTGSECSSADPNHGLEHDGDHRRGKPQEDRFDDFGLAQPDVQRGEAQ